MNLNRSLQEPLATRSIHPLTWLPWILSIGVVCITFFFAWQAEQTRTARDELRFTHQADQTLQAIQKRIDTYINFLVATRAHLVTQREINATTFYNYLNQLDVEYTFPGIQAVGFAERALPEDRQTLTNRLQSEGYRDFAIFPNAATNEAYVVTYIYPLTEINKKALGFDMFSEPTRRGAMEAARASESVMASGKVQLVQDVGPQRHAGFLIFLPTFIPTFAAPHAKFTFRGFVYSAFRCDDLLQGIFGKINDPLIDFVVYDGDDAVPQNELHNSAQYTPPLSPKYKPEFSERRTLQVANRTWTISFTSRPQFEALTDRFPSQWLLIIGASLTSLFFLTGWMSAVSHRRALRQREWLRVTLASIGDAVIATDANGQILFLNSTAERLTGWSQYESIGLPLSQILTVMDDVTGTPLEDIVGQAVRQGDPIAFTGDISVKRRNGKLVPVEDTASPIKDASGRIRGAIIVLHDISARKSKEHLDNASAQVIKILAYARSLDEVAEELIREVCKGLRCDYGALWSFDDATGNLRCRVNVGMSNEDYEVARETYRSSSPSWMILSADFSSPPLYSKLAHAGYATVIGIPILVQGHPRGAMTIVSRSAIPSDADTLVWLSSLALQLGQLVERKQEETRRQAIIEGAFDSIISFNPHGKILEMNEAAEHMFRGSREDLRQVPISQLVESPELAALLHGGESVKNSLNRVTKTNARTPRDDAFPIELTITEATIDGSPLFTAFIRKIPDQQRETSNLGIHSEVLHNMSEGVCLTDERGMIIFSNPGEERMLNYERGELIGKNISLLFAEPAELLPSLIKNPSKQHVEGRFSGELRARCKGGDVITTYTQISGITFSGRRYLLCVQDDITDPKQAEQDRARLLESERAARSQLERASQIKDEFLATLSHELRTPLNAILGWAHLIRRNALDKERLQQGLEVIEKNARTQAQMIADLLDMSRIISGKIRLEARWIDAKGIIDSAIDTVAPVAQEKHISIRTHLDSELGAIQGDPTRLQQVLWNLLTNAVRFSSPKSAIDVRAKKLDGEIHISIQDYGEGIKPEFVPHVFDRFRQADASTTRRHGGLGLGLSIVKHLVELHGGSVSVESGGLGKGATFSVSLPRIPATIPSQGPSSNLRAAKPHPFQSAQPSLMGVRILAVDDEEDTRNLLKVVLEEEGAVVTTAASSKEALQHIETKNPDLIVSDISMPGEDGYQLIRQVRARAHSGEVDVPAIALTAFARPEDKEQALAAGFQAHLTKPIEPAKLIQAAAAMAHH